MWPGFLLREYWVVCQDRMCVGFLLPVGDRVEPESLFHWQFLSEHRSFSSDRVRRWFLLCEHWIVG